MLTINLFNLFLSSMVSFKKYANDKGIKIIGDMPFYVDHGSVEVWLDNQSFLLDEAGYPTSVAGVPPDYFSPTGQYWGNPLYDWKYLKFNKLNFGLIELAGLVRSSILLVLTTFEHLIRIGIFLLMHQQRLKEVGNMLPATNYLINYMPL